jgi:hypothetical protein
MTRCPCVSVCLSVPVDGSLWAVAGAFVAATATRMCTCLCICCCAPTWHHRCCCYELQDTLLACYELT